MSVYDKNSSGDEIQRDSERELLRSAPWKLLEFAEITQNNGHYAVQGHRFWYQSKAYIRFPISA